MPCRGPFPTRQPGRYLTACIRPRPGPMKTLPNPLHPATSAERQSPDHCAQSPTCPGPCAPLWGHFLCAPLIQPLGELSTLPPRGPCTCCCLCLDSPPPGVCVAPFSRPLGSLLHSRLPARVFPHPSVPAAARPPSPLGPALIFRDCLLGWTPHSTFTCSYVRCLPL